MSKQIESISIDGLQIRKALYKLAKYSRELLEPLGSTSTLIPYIHSLIELSMFAEDEVIKNLKFIQEEEGETLSIVRKWKCFDIEGEVDLKWAFVPESHIKILSSLELLKVHKDYQDDLSKRHSELKRQYNKKKVKDGN
jgi:hypothetical protein|nr:MAG TPA: hypothetical protein [Caudoviricetes sp.]